MRALPLALAVFAALPAEAGSLRCQTRGYCTNELTCSPDDAVMEVQDNRDGTYTFGWIGQPSFTAQVVKKDGFDILISNDAPKATQILTIAPSMDATFNVTTEFVGRLYVSIQALRCEEVVSG